MDWTVSPAGVGISNRSLLAKKNNTGLGFLDNTRRSAIMILTSPCITDLYTRTRMNFDKMYAKRAFVHWYVSEGLSEGFFEEACENLNFIIRDYEDDFNLGCSCCCGEGEGEHEGENDSIE